MALGSDGDGDGRGGEKRRRLDEQGRRCEEAAAAKGEDVVPAARRGLSDLSIDLRRFILTLLPIKDAIRTAAIDRGWRDLWKSRWHPASSRDIHIGPRDIPNQVLDALEGGPRPRLDRFSIVFDNGKLRPTHLKRLLAYAAECRVEDLHFELRRAKLGSNLSFHFPQSSPRLVHLSLRGIAISNRYYRGARHFAALDAIHLHSVRISGLTFRKMMALCPKLRTLDLRRCDFKDLEHGAEAIVPPAGRNLRTITIAECEGEVRLNAVPIHSLRSFRYSGNYQASPFFLPRNAALAQLYISCGNPVPRRFTLFPNYFDEGLPEDLSRLTVLTICSNALKVASILLNNGATTQWTSLCNLKSLRELQLLIFSLDANNLANIYVFLKASNCLNLERIFVQLPAISDVSLENLFDEVGVELPEDSLSNLRMVKVINFNWRRFEVQLVSFLLRKGASSSYHYEPPSWAASSLVDELATQNPKLSNLQNLRELQLPMRKMGADNLANVYMFLKTCQCTNLERLFVLLPTSDCVSMAASLDGVGEEPPEDALDNLKIVKIMNFNWRSIEVQLVSFLLRKASSLHKLLLVFPHVVPLDMLGVQEADLLLIKEALSNGKIVISESDDVATRPYHSEIFIEV